MEPPAARAAGQSIFALVFGLFLGLALLKFGNPPIFEKWVTVPHGFFEFVLGFPWPISWAYGLVIFVAVLGAVNIRHPHSAPAWVAIAPALWLIWLFVTTTQSQDTALSEPTLKHLAVCVVCFYFGLFSLSHVKQFWLFWIGVIGCFCLVLASGFEQHFGGLEQTRRYFFLYMYPTMPDVSPEYLKKMSSTRIFSTLFYPNALAGLLLLLLPPTVAVVWHSKRFTKDAKVFLVGIFVLAALACLFWSGSKGGWLLMVVLGVVGLLHARMNLRYKYALLAVLLLLSLTGFGLKYAGFFEKGATSVSARFDYWRAAVATAGSSPLFGTGPGTFAIPYAKIKRPESEMSRLVHNDYLEQASDSGIVGFVLYTGMVVGLLFYTHPRQAKAANRWVHFAIWLGLLGFCLQGLMEFGLYIPALAWTAFALFGVLFGQTGQRNPSTKLNETDTVRSR